MMYQLMVIYVCYSLDNIYYNTLKLATLMVIYIYQLISKYSLYIISKNRCFNRFFVIKLIEKI